MKQRRRGWEGKRMVAKLSEVGGGEIWIGRSKKEIGRKTKSKLFFFFFSFSFGFFLLFRFLSDLGFQFFFETKEEKRKRWRKI